MKHTLTITLACLAFAGVSGAQGADDFENGNPSDWSFDGRPNTIEGGDPTEHGLSR